MKTALQLMKSKITVNEAAFLVLCGTKSMTRAQVSRAVGLSPTYISKVFFQLEAKRLIEPPSDQRRLNTKGPIILTPKGHQIAQLP